MKRTLKTTSLIALLFLLFSGAASAQSKFTISGKITDAENGEELIGATVLVKEKPGIGAITNSYGFYSLTLPEGSYTLIYGFIGFDPVEKSITLNADQKISMELGFSASEMESVVVEAEAENQNVEKVQMSTEELNVEEVKIMPALFGEVDIIKTLTLLPGVQNAGEGTTGLFVRGGANDQNLVLLDDAPVYNASHLLGFFSVFNSDAIKDVQLYKGGIPAQFGGRLSSILDIRMNEGNSKDFEASGGIGTISSRLTVEGPIAKDKASFIVSGRRTYADLFLNFANDPDLRNNQLYFYDFNAKVNYKINDKNRIFLSGYFGRDVLKFDETFGIDWGNTTGTLRWNSVLNDKLFLNTTLIYSDFDYGFEIDNGAGQNFQWESSLRDIQAKLSFDYYLSPKNTLIFGIDNIYHEFTPARIEPINNESIFNAIKLDRNFAFEQAAYIGNEQKVTPKLTLQYGLRWSAYQNVGKGNEYLYGEGQDISDETITDTLRYDNGFNGRNFYHGLEPRLGAKYTIGKTSSVKASYNRTRQYIQSVATNTASLPFDRWIGSSRYLEPQIGDQIAAGYFRNFDDNTYEASVEGYYKWMENQLDVRNGADVLVNNNVEEALAAGRAWSYGAEFMLRKNKGFTTGWVSYTWSKTQRQIDAISQGNAYSPRYDRRHDISLVVTHRFSERLILSGNWVYSTGAAVSFPVARYELEGLIVDYYDDANRNGNRMPDYHRMDLSLTVKGKQRRRWQGSWNFSVYNAYNRYNAFTITFREKTDDDGNGLGEMEAVQQTLFGIIPSVSYNFRFLARRPDIKK